MRFCVRRIVPQPMQQTPDYWNSESPRKTKVILLFFPLILVLKKQHFT
jgi:hypothetical protein